MKAVKFNSKSKEITISAFNNSKDINVWVDGKKIRKDRVIKNIDKWTKTTIKLIIDRTNKTTFN